MDCSKNNRSWCFSKTFSKDFAQTSVVDNFCYGTINSIDYKAYNITPFNAILRQVYQLLIHYEFQISYVCKGAINAKQVV